MTDWEQFEAWIELRVLERRATRSEVYALRRFRRLDSPATRAQLRNAYVGATIGRALVDGMRRIAAPAIRALATLGRALAEVQADQFEQTDLGEFNNRAHDWMRS